MKRIIALFVLLCIGSSSHVLAQGVSSMGTDFWLGFMPNFNVPASEVALHIASGTKNTVTIEYYSGSLDGKPTGTKVITLNADEAKSVSLDIGMAENWEMEKAVYKAIHVTAKFPIVVYGTSNGGATADGFLALPTPGLGTEHYAACFYDDKYLSFPWPLAGEFMIVAPYDGTVVTIKTTANTRLDLDATKQGHKQGDVWTVALRRGQCYLVQSSGIEVGDQDLTGSHIVSNKPIALLTGHQRCAIPAAGDDVDSRDHLIEMIPSVDKWGTEYYERSYYNRPGCGDYIRLLSAEDGNTIQINGNQTIQLNAGEFNERPLTIGTEVYKSLNNKKFIALQYLYSELHNGDQFRIDPDLIVLTPQKQFQKKIIFRTIINPNDPQSADFKNIITVICRADSIDNVMLNGEKITVKAVGPKAYFLNTNPQMAARHVLLGTGAKTWIATSNEPMGIYLYGYTNVEGYGFPAGMALTYDSPDTLPPIHAPKDLCGDFDVLLREPRLEPNPFDDTKITQIALLTEPDDPRLDRSASRKPSTNYTISFSADFDQTGAPIDGPDSSTTFFLRVIDKSIDAFAAVYTTDHVGNDTVFEYSYIAPKVSPVTEKLSFTPTLVGTDSCRTFVVRNVSPTGSITFTEALVDDTAKFGKFTVTPNVLGTTLAPGDSVVVTLCYEPSDTLPVSLDLLTLKTTCIDYKFPLDGLGVTPLIYAEDLDFGDVDSGATKCLPLKIKNPGRWPLTIRKQDLPATTEFSVSPSVIFPIIIPPGGEVTIDYCFHPTSYGTHTATAFFTTENPVQFLHSIKDTSSLRGRVLKPGAQWHLFTHDFGKVNCTTKATIVDTLFNDEQKNQVIDKVEIIGTDATSFRIVSVSPVLAPPYATSLATRSSGFAGYAFTIEYDPNVKGTPGPANAMIVAYQAGETDLNKQPTTFLTGERIAPALALLPAPATVDLGTTAVGGQLTGQFEVQNTGSDILRVLTINSASADAPMFVLNPAPPFNVPVSGSQIVNVTFTAPQTAGSFTATFEVDPAACAVKLPVTLLAQATSTQFLIQGADYPLTYVCRTRDTTLAFFRNLSSNETVTLESVTVEARGTRVDVNDFILITPWTAKAVAPGAREDVPIRFIPQGTGLRQAALVFVYRRQDGTFDTLIANLGGTSDAIQRIAGVGNTTTGGTYIVGTNDQFVIPIVLNTPLASQTSEVYGAEFTLSWQQDLLNSVQFEPGPGLGTPSEQISVDPVTKIESRKYRLSNPGIGINGVTDFGTLKGIVMVAKDIVSPITISGVTFLDVNMQPTLCYIQTQEIPGLIQAKDICGDASLRLFLNGGGIFAVKGVKVGANRIATVDITTRMRVPLSLEVRNALGAVVRTVPANVYEAGDHSLLVPVSDLPSGMYFVRLTDGSASASDQFLLAR